MAQPSIYNGFLEGSVRQNGGDLDFLPFGDVGEATMIYNSENSIVETFSRQGVRGASASCPLREELTFQVSSESITWNLLQLALNTRAEDSDVALNQSDTVVLSETDEGSENSVVTLPFEVSSVGSVYVANTDGKQYDVTVTIGSGETEIEFDDDYTGEVVSVSYSLAPTGENNLIKIGSGVKLGELGIYGRFKGCPNSLLVVVPRGIIQSELNLSASDGAASAGFTITAMRDDNDNYGYLLKI